MRTDSLLEVAAVSRTGRVVTAERTAASGFMPPLHAHAADEAIYVVEGHLTVFAGADVVTVEAGETFVVAERVAHTFRVGPSGARIVFSTFAASASRYDDFLRATAGGGAADAPFTDPGALDDPGVAGVEAVLQVDVGDDLVGQGTAPAGDAGAGGSHGTHLAASGRATRTGAAEVTASSRGAPPRNGLAAREPLAGHGEKALHGAVER